MSLPFKTELGDDKPNLFLGTWKDFVSYFRSTCNLCRYSTKHVSIRQCDNTKNQFFLRLTVASQETTDFINCVVIL